VEDKGVEPDLDDTRKAVPRVPAVRPGVDVEDTVVRSGTHPRADIVEAMDPPALVEPPLPEVRPVPLEEVDVLPVAEEPVPPPRVRLPDGAEVVLDAPVLIGRKPSTPRIAVGPVPKLVALPSPGREMSATHLELRTVGDSLVASDMRSTNGTVVVLPGAAPRTLIRGESAVVVPGTRIDLGEGAVLDILAPDGEVS
jgi:hypothetical protein